MFLEERIALLESQVRELSKLAAELAYNSGRASWLPPDGSPDYRRGLCRKSLQAVAEVTGISVQELIGERRTKPITEARYAAAWLATELCRASQGEIAETFRYTSPSSIAAARSRAADLRTVDVEFRQMTDELLKKLHAENPAH